MPQSVMPTESMSGIGPALPPHILAKRKRKQEEQAKDEDTTTSGAKRSESPNDRDKRRRVAGPAMPPAPLEDVAAARSKSVEESESSDDDDFGPALPPTEADQTAQDVDNDDTGELHNQTSSAAPARPQRDEWMMLPPKQDDLAARMDPSKQRARGFNTGKGAKGPNSKDEDNSAWYETPEQKQRRLQEEMMGTAKSASTATPEAAKHKKSAKEEAEEQKRRQQIEKSRGPSLVEQHKKSKGASAEEDDPSKRAFDREKDMASGSGISGAQKAEMLKKAGGFSSRFAGGSYL
ncbi:hypothetical protein KC331_g17432 [Hortaea werneckii]|nr:hypothetical protein KC331_g17432 [Hortaea werneckii]KAI7696542.1 hypothetical protein KC353_g17465 [Hortaea werneckii]